ncbi:MAG TPA: PorP/SprF family type IX secretion system membrane protein [Cyclobacteriaceae bacterium]|nr:PorP/SprF family type IX secretion system membrane protein [Cyclobacteriaceae bacterium]
MSRLFGILMFAVHFFWIHQVRAQNYPVYNSFMINPYLYNPAEVASDHFYIFFNHRQQWTGIEGSPTLSTVNFSTLINESFTGIGAKASNFSRGILRTTDFMLTYAHGIALGDENVVFFGLSGGAITNSIDFTKLDPADLDDPALTGYLANNIQPAASFGMVFRSTSGLNIGFSLPQLFMPAFTSPSHFSATEFSPFDNAYAMVYYRKKTEGKVVSRRRKGVRRRVRTSGGYAPLELYALYKYSSFGTNQFEATAKLNLSDNFWLGAGYRQAYGFTAHTGFALGKFMLSYSFEPGNQPEEGFSTGTHEIQLGLRLGEEKTYRRKNPVIRSTLQKTPEARHQARFSGSQNDLDRLNQSEPTAKRTYYVVLRAFTDFAPADAYKKRVVDAGYNADVFYHHQEKRYYVFVLSTTKASEAAEEARNLQKYTRLKNAKVISVQSEK